MLWMTPRRVRPMDRSNARTCVSPPQISGNLIILVGTQRTRRVEAHQALSGRATAKPSSDSRVPQVCYAIARLDRAVASAIAQQVSPYGLTTLQYTVLSVLHRGGVPLPNADLARRFNMRPQSMQEVLDALEEKQLIRRDPHPSHGRLLPAILTARGRQVLKACDAAVVDLEERMFASFDSAARTRFVEMAREGLRVLRTL